MLALHGVVLSYSKLIIMGEEVVLGTEMPSIPQWGPETSAGMRIALPPSMRDGAAWLCYCATRGAQEPNL